MVHLDLLINTDKFGGIAFRVNDNVSWYSKFNEEISEILFLGKTAPYFDSTNWCYCQAGRC